MESVEITINRFPSIVASIHVNVARSTGTHCKQNESPFWIELIFQKAADTRRGERASPWIKRDLMKIRAEAKPGREIKCHAPAKHAVI